MRWSAGRKPATSDFMKLTNSLVGRSTSTSRLVRILPFGLALAALSITVACDDGGDSNGGGLGTGATTGVGGATGVGGTMGTGAATGSGATTGVGGASGSGSTTGSGATTGTGGATGSGSATGTGGGSSSCSTGDTCPAPNGVEWQCQKRFMVGTNWAWKNWGADFGGITAWGKKGVSQDAAAFSADMATLKAGGTSVIRWWMWPRFLTESITWGADDAPSAVGGTLIADVQKALELAEQNDVFIMFSPFSFDNFGPTKDESGINSRGIKGIVTDATKRGKLLNNLIRPVAQAIEASPYKHRMLAWDLINEPEWAMTGPNPNDTAAFEPNEDLESVTHAEMKVFLDELTVVIREESSALVTIGSAAIKWGNAWRDFDVDFYSLHYYDWVYQWFPYDTVTPASKGLTGKPVVMGEFPYGGLSAFAAQNLPAQTLGEFLNGLWDVGYAGALGWAFTDPNFQFDGTGQKAFADTHACETAY